MIDPELRAAQAADHLAELVEAAARGLKRKRHKAHLDRARGRIRKLVAEYFRRQGAYFLAAVRPHIRAGLVAYPPQPAAARESAQVLRPGAPVATDGGGWPNGSTQPAGVNVREASATGKRFSHAIMPSSVSPLSYPVTREEDQEYQAAIQEAITAAAGVVAAEIGASAARGTEIGQDLAGRYLRENSLSKLTGGFSPTSIERLQNAIGDAWDKGGSYDQIVAAIQNTFDTFSDTRAGLVAQTEVVDAYNYGRNQTAKALKMRRKRWETESGNPCETCLANEAEGWIDIGDDFSSGDAEPTAHPNCECILSYSDEEGEEEGEE